MRAPPPTASRTGRATTTRNFSKPPGPCPIAPKDEIISCWEPTHSDFFPGAGPRPIAPRDGISRSGEPLTPICSSPRPDQDVSYILSEARASDFDCASIRSKFHRAAGKFSILCGSVPKRMLDMSMNVPPVVPFLIGASWAMSPGSTTSGSTVVWVSASMSLISQWALFPYTTLFRSRE